MSTFTKQLKKLINAPLRRIGFQLDRYSPSGPVFIAGEASKLDEQIYSQVAKFTMSPPDPIYSLISTVRYVIDNEIEGDFVECGTWRGGCAMAIALTLSDLGVSDRTIWVYDTFHGMTKPGVMDLGIDLKAGEMKISSEKLFVQQNGTEDGSEWARVSLHDVQSNLSSTGYPLESIEYVKGDVTETLNETVPRKISLLRLDTDWYESTLKELEVLYPRLSVGGVCIVDDYGAWAGARQAVDEYFDRNPPLPLFHVTNWTVRTFTKTEG
jgi:O-methyltransferase